MPNTIPVSSTTSFLSDDALSVGFDGASIERHWALVVGETVHAVVARLCTEGLPVDRFARQLAALDATNDATAAFELSTVRIRAMRIEVSTFVCVYSNRFLPGPAWRPVGTEMMLSRSRLDLAWRHVTSGVVVIDELKTGRTRNGLPRVKDQVLRHLAGAVERWGDDVAGVRLLWLAAPHSSQFQRPGSNRAFNLRDSDYADMTDPRPALVVEGGDCR